MSDHDDVVAKISEAYEKRGFQVQNRRNNLPQGSRRVEAIYRPDLLVKSQSSGQIACIVEVETSAQAGKSIAGAAILADVCIEIEKERGRQQKSPKLIFVFYRPSANLKLAEKRLIELTRYNRIKCLEEILFLSEKGALEKISQSEYIA